MQIASRGQGSVKQGHCLRLTFTLESSPQVCWLWLLRQCKVYPGSLPVIGWLPWHTLHLTLLREKPGSLCQLFQSENIWFSRQVSSLHPGDEALLILILSLLEQWHSAPQGVAEPESEYDAQETSLQSSLHWADSCYCLQSLPGILYQYDFTKADSGWCPKGASHASVWMEWDGDKETLSPGVRVAAS